MEGGFCLRKAKAPPPVWRKGQVQKNAFTGDDNNGLQIWMNIKYEAKRDASVFISSQAINKNLMEIYVPRLTDLKILFAESANAKKQDEQQVTQSIEQKSVGRHTGESERAE